MTTKTINAHLYFGKIASGKTYTMRETVNNLLNENKDMSYAILSEDPFNLYQFDEGHTKKPITLRYNDNSVEIVTDADIIIVQELRRREETALFVAAMQTGKQVFGEIHGSDLELATSKVQHLFKSYGDLTNNPNFTHDLLSNYLIEAPGLPLQRAENEPPIYQIPGLIFERTEAELPILKFETLDSLEFHECEIPKTAGQRPTAITHSDFANVDLISSGVRVVFGQNPENFTTIFEGLLNNLIENGIYSSYAVFSEYKKNKTFSMHKDKRKLIKTYFATTKEWKRPFLGSETEAEVIIVPRISDHQMMDFLKIALATGKPVVVGIDANNTANAKALFDYLETTGAVMNYMYDHSLRNCVVTEVETDAEPRERPTASASIVNFGHALPIEDGVSTVAW